MKPIVLVGGGVHHYRVLQNRNEKDHKSRPTILVAEKNQIFPKAQVPKVLNQMLKTQECLLDLWSLCQRTGVFFIKDECLNINRDDQILFLKKYGKLEYGTLSIETRTEPLAHSAEAQLTSVIQYKNSDNFIDQMKIFFKEVHSHCPREIRVIIHGLSSQSLDLAFIINERLKKSCQTIDIVLISEGPEDQKRIKNLTPQLRAFNIRIVNDGTVSNVKNHLLELSNGKKIEFDIFIPFSHWRSKDTLGKLMQADNSMLLVEKDLSYEKDNNIFFTGENVFIKDSDIALRSIDEAEVVRTLLHNIFTESESKTHCRKIFKNWWERPFLKQTGILSLFTNEMPPIEDVKKHWVEDTKTELRKIKKLPVFENAQKNLLENLQYEADHMSRPWKGILESAEASKAIDYRLNSFNGFNCWGSYTDSTIKICEIALLKAMARGVLPEQLRFSLSLPRGEPYLNNHIFESTLKAIEEVAQNSGIEIDGGDTFDGRHWHLMVTVGGKVYHQYPNRFRSHDYLIMTRPLGFGFLWANRLKDDFNSTWIENSLQAPYYIKPELFTQFAEKWDPSALVLIEEWGFLYHCLQSLPGHQQLLVNFREVPRWPGVDQVLKNSIPHPALDANWDRIKEDVAFQREDISFNNSIMWDSLSQGSLVIGVSAANYKQALSHLQEMGYKEATLVGCVRPKHNNNKVVLSDWIPQ